MTNFEEPEKSEHMDMSSHMESSIDNNHHILLDQSNDAGFIPNRQDTFKGTIYGDSMIEQTPPVENNPLNNPKSLGSDHQYMFLSPNAKNED